MFILGGATGIAGFSSLSSLEWDPEYIWRPKSKNRFYLTTCKQGRGIDDNEKSAWNNSVLQIYLTVKDSSSEIKNGTPLQLVGKGHYQKFRGSTPVNSMTHEDPVDLHKDNGSGETWFVLSIGNVSQKTTLGETGGGPDSERWGALIVCDKQIFTFNDSNPSSLSASLLHTSFSLEKCGDVKNNYKGKQGCSIGIKETESSKGLKWSTEFKPIIVIN
ncbi:hypothetical protein [Mycoplasma wenyonii]|uniref:hypothetical protein n=1 Tax=Mycoplasma wenyonii TaxID=65123 RepID=UPI0005C6E986|nr:hypothetical protein [Mycoplasma wenyonii]